MAQLILSIELVNVDTVRRSLYIGDIYDVIENHLRVSPGDISVIQKCGPMAKSYNVGVCDAGVWNRHDLDSFIDDKVRLDSGAVVLIQRAFEKHDEVTVKNIPPHWEREHVERIFGFYGVVQSMTQETLRYSESRDCKPAYAKVWNGNWRIKMKVRRSIPSTLMVSNNQIEIFYRNQRKTCWRCGMDHPKKDCKTKYENFINRFSLDEFPLVGTVANTNVPMSEEAAVVNEELKAWGHQQAQELMNQNRGRSHQTTSASNSDVQEHIVVAEVMHSDDSQIVRETVEPKEKESTEDTTILSSQLWEISEDTVPPPEPNVSISSGDGARTLQPSQTIRVEATLENSQWADQVEELGIGELALQEQPSLDPEATETGSEGETRGTSPPSSSHTSQTTPHTIQVIQPPEHMDTQMEQSELSKPPQEKPKTNPDANVEGCVGELEESQSLFSSPDSQITPGQKTTHTDHDYSQRNNTQAIVAVMESRNQSEGFWSFDNGNKRDRKELQSSTEDESDNGTIRLGLGSVVNSLYSSNKSKKKKEGDSDNCTD